MVWINVTDMLPGDGSRCGVCFNCNEYKVLGQGIPGENRCSASEHPGLDDKKFRGIQLAVVDWAIQTPFFPSIHFPQTSLFELRCVFEELC